MASCWRVVFRDTNNILTGGFHTLHSSKLSPRRRISPKLHAIQLTVLWDLRFALIHPFVALQQKRLCFGILSLAQECANQLLFGSDLLMIGQEVPQCERHDSLNLPDDVQQKIDRGNAIRILMRDGLK